MFRKYFFYIAKSISLVSLIGVILVIFIFNYSLYYSPNYLKQDDSDILLNEDVYFQLKHLKTQLQKGADQQMQMIYPEGNIFINVLYGLSWCEFISNQPKDSKIFKEGINEISRVVHVIQRPSSKTIFSKDLPLKHGAFYRGWSNYFLGKKLLLQKGSLQSSHDIEEFNKTCMEINSALKVSKSPYLESYQNMKWPADGIIAISSLKLYNIIYDTVKYDSTLENCLSKIKSNLDNETGLIPHSIDAQNDKIIEGARGSSQSLMLLFLKDLDNDFATVQFMKYKNQFVEYRLGLPGIREYPKGKDGFGDVDSGPVILGIGGAASIVGQRTMGVYEKWDLYTGLRNCIETFGCSMTSKSEKKYLLGELPMADAFIAWSNSVEKTKVETNLLESWRLKIQILSILGIIVSVLLIKKLIKLHND